jgi:hypothetical protein
MVFSDLVPDALEKISGPAVGIVLTLAFTAIAGIAAAGASLIA